MLVLRFVSSDWELSVLQFSKKKKKREEFAEETKKIKIKKRVDCETIHSL